MLNTDKKRLFWRFCKRFASSLGVGVFLLSSLLGGLAQNVQAAEAWTGQEVERSHGRIELKPGAAFTFTIKFKNTGTATWRNDTSSFVALATVDPEKRKSAFQHAFWNEESYRPARLLEKQVRPGETGTFRFALQAPQKEGEYNEAFMAVAKNTAWIEGTKFTIPLVVTSTFTAKPSAPATGNGALAADYPVQNPNFDAEWAGGQIREFTAEPGQQIFQTFEVKNVGSEVWKNSGPQYVSIYTVRPNYHDSDFYVPGPGWISKQQIRLATDLVRPGETGKVVLLLQAPSQAGTYTEHLRLGVENHTWMKGGELRLVVTVPGAQESAPSEEAPTPQESSIYKDQSYGAQFLISSGAEITLKPGQTVSYQVGFKNVGEKVWRKTGEAFVSMYTIEPNYRSSRFARTNSSINSGWLSTSQIALSQDEVSVGHLAFFRFDLTAPSTPGRYEEKFRLAVEDKTWIKGGEFTLPIIVEGGTGVIPSPTPDTVPQGELGPIMRVGLFHSTNAFSITADSPFEVRSGNGELLVSLPAKSEVRIDYLEGSGQYSVQALGLDRTLSDYVVAKALDEQTIMEILSFERRLPWNPAVNENLFRGSVEIRHSNATNRTWAINILPMEHYLRGIAETSSSSPVEFLKVMSVAARTYGYYHYERQTKHADEHFYVDSDLDQVYRGYALEKRHPGLVEAVVQTEGEVVTYTNPTTGEKKIAITPYFSRSDGRTRAWSEVWGGNVPWTQSVSVPHDQGLSLLGHGVGLSARGGLLMVVEDGATYQQVLHYFFQGIQIEPKY